MLKSFVAQYKTTLNPPPNNPPRGFFKEIGKLDSLKKFNGFLSSITPNPITADEIEGIYGLLNNADGNPIDTAKGFIFMVDKTRVSQRAFYHIDERKTGDSHCALFFKFGNTLIKEISVAVTSYFFIKTWLFFDNGKLKIPELLQSDYHHKIIFNKTLKHYFFNYPENHPPYVQLLPYPYPTIDKIENIKYLNGRTIFPGTTEKICCSELSHQYILDCIRHPDGKVNLHNYESPENISSHVIRQGVDKIETLYLCHGPSYLIHNHSLGDLCICRFNHMGNHQEKISTMLLCNTIHLMVMRLRIKQQNGKTYYVLSLFDPNRTNNTTRIKVDDLSQLKSLTLKHFMDSYAYSIIFSEHRDEILLAIVYDPAIIKPSINPYTERTLSQVPISSANVLPENISRDVMFLLLLGGYDRDIEQLINNQQVQELSAEQYYVLLTPSNATGSLALNRLVALNHIKVIQSYLPLYKKIPANHRAPFLTLSNSHYPPLLVIALKKGYTAMLMVLKEFLLLVPENERASLLAMTDEKGLSPLYLALIRGHTDSVLAFADLVKLVPMAQRTEVITMRHWLATFPGLSIKYANNETYDAYLELRALLP